MLVHSEQEMINLGEKIGAEIAQSEQGPVIFELLADVGAGKTTFTRGLAKGIGVSESVTSPSFTISKTYQGQRYRLVHYDFYRLADPGIMCEDLSESISGPNTITVIEWGQSIQDILPSEHRKIEISYIDENTREVTIQ